VEPARRKAQLHLQCPLGYTGANCETNINDCASNPCQHGGTCTDGVGGYTCTCVPGYDGTNCENDIDDCASNPCQNDGVCQDGVNGSQLRLPERVRRHELEQ
jgi:Notch-like protein